MLPANFKNFFTTWQEQFTAAAQYLKLLLHPITAYLRLEVESASIDSVVKQAIALLEVQEVEKLPRVQIQDYTKQGELETDLAKIKQLIVNAILYIQDEQLTSSVPTIVRIENTSFSYSINGVGEHMKNIPAICFIFTNAINTQVYVIPVQIREVWPKKMDLVQMDVDAFQPISDEAYPGAAEQEAELSKAVKSNTAADFRVVEKALKIIKKFHGPVKRKSGKPFCLHPVTVAKIVLSYTQEQDIIIAALLHDLVEDTAFSLPQVKLMFKTRVQRIVDGVTHLYSNFNTLHKIKLAAH